MSTGRAPSHTPASSSRIAISYVYGIVPAGVSTANAPLGIDGQRVTTVVAGDVAALVSTLDEQDYAPQLIEERVGDVEWLAPRAEAHDAVVTWASQRGPVVPLHMWTLFSDSDAVSDMLRRRAGAMAPVLERLRGSDEYGLRVYADARVLQRVAASSDEAIAELEQYAAESGPGQRYLLERKLEGARREAARTIARTAADLIFEQLSVKSADATRDPIPNIGAAEAGAVLSAAFLVRRKELDAFRAVLTKLIGELEPQGFRFAFTGPWPPYHFASDTAT